MKINPIITGSTGMVGKGVLLECLDDARVGKVLVVNRRPLSMEHEKLKEVILEDFGDPTPIAEDIKGYNAVFFCMGVSAGGMKEEDYRRITYDYTIRFAKLFRDAHPGGTFIYVSGAGTDTSEKGRMMWARVKGKTENELIDMFGENAYMFRPGIIQPRRGVKSSTGWYNAAYKVLRPFWPVLNSLFGKHITDTQKIGRAMIALADKGSGGRYFGNGEINGLGEG